MAPSGAHFERLDLLRLELEDRNEHEGGATDDEKWSGGQDDDEDYLDLHDLERSDGDGDEENDEEDDEGDGGGEEGGDEEDGDEEEGNEEGGDERPCRRFVDDAAAGEEDGVARRRRGRRRQRGKGGGKGNAGDGDDGNDTAPRRTKPLAAAPVAAVSTELMTSLFGPQSTAFQATNRDPDADGCESEDDSVTFGVPSDDAQASQLRTERELFSVPGVACVGCCLGATRLRHLDAFVNDHATSTQPEALWRLAASVYVDTVVTPCRREGVVAPAWSKEGVRIHYEHHALCSKLTRVAMLREMRGVREMIVRRLVRVGDDGEREADHKTTEQYLKMVAAESREHAQLAAMDAPAGGRRGTPAPGRGGGRATVPGGGDDAGGKDDGN